MVNSKLTILIFSFVLILNMSATPARADSIRDHCKGIAGESYSLMETCMRGEEEARGRLQSHSIDPRIASYYAYEAMSEIINAEIERNLYLPNSDVPLRLAEKYEEIWKIIDPSIPEVSVQ